jgi:hypothetical protein
MLKTLLGVAVELLLAVAIAGLILAVAVPLVAYTNLAGANDFATRALITGVLICAIVIALFRPGSATRRHRKR